MKNSNLTYTPHIDSDFGYQPKYLGRISNYRSVQEVPTSEIEEESTPLQFTPQEEISETIDTNTDVKPENTFTPKKYTPKKGTEWGHRQFVQYYRQSGAPENEMDFWSRIAQDESGFTPGIVGSNEKYGVEALGYFQMLTKHNFKPMDIAGAYSGVDAQTFLNNPIIQIQAAQNMKNSIMNQFTENDLAVARSKGYTDSALVAGAWAGGVGGVRNWIHYGKNAVDVNVKDGKNSKRKWECSVAGRMEALNGYFKNGGILRFQDGGINEAKDWYSDWIDRRRDIYKSNYNDNHFLPSIGAQASNLALHNMNLTTVSIDPSKVPDDADGVYRPLNRTIALNEANPEYAVHEFAHSTRPVDQVKKIDDIKDKHSNLFLNSSTQKDTYTDDSEEMYARFMSLRYILEKMGININREFTSKDVQDLLNMFTNKLILKTPNGSSTFSTDGKLLKSGIKGNINPGESSIERDIDYRIRDTIGRYNLNVSAEILSNVASIEKKLPRLGRLGMKFEGPDDIHTQTESWVNRMNQYTNVKQDNGLDRAPWYVNLRNNIPYNEPLMLGTHNGKYYIYPKNRRIPVNDYTIDQIYNINSALEDNVALPVPNREVAKYFSANRSKFFKSDPYVNYKVRRSYDRNAISNYNGHSDSYYDIVHNRIARIQKEMKNYGFTQEEIDRLLIPLTIQSIKETGWWDATNSTNQGGHLKNGETLIKYDTPESFWRHHFKNLDEKWPGWRKANNIEEYINIINNPKLNTTLEEYNNYNKERRRLGEREEYLYAPKWNNGGRDYWKDDIQPTLDRFYGYYYMGK